MTVSELTTYVILVAPEGEVGFVVLPTPVSARTAEEAVRKTVEAARSPDGPQPSRGTFVAVPSRSWRPLRVRQETQIRLKVEEASVEEEVADVDA